MFCQPCENSNDLGKCFASSWNLCSLLLEEVHRWNCPVSPGFVHIYNISIYICKCKRLDLSMSRLHNLEVRAPRGNFVKSIVIEPRKSSLDQNYERAEEVKCVREKYKITH